MIYFMYIFCVLCWLGCQHVTFKYLTLILKSIVSYRLWAFLDARLCQWHLQERLFVPFMIHFLVCCNLRAFFWVKVLYVSLGVYFDSLGIPL